MRRLWLPLGVCAALALLTTAPLVFQGGTHMAGAEADNQATLWTIWYHGVYAPGASADAPPLLNFPYGTDLSLRPGAWLSTLPTVWLARALGEVWAFNLTVLVSFFLTAWFAFLLGRRLTGEAAAGYVAAAALSWLPYHLAMAEYHFTLMRLEVLPLLLLALVAFEARPGWLRAVGVALAFGACTYMDPHYGLFGVVVVGAFAVTFLWGKRAQPKPWGPWALAGVLSVLLVVPWAQDWLNRSAEENLVAPRPFSQLYDYAARPMAYVTPYLSQATWYRQSLAGLPRGLWHEQALFLGFVPLGLAVWGGLMLWRRRHRWAVFLGLMCAGGVLFSLPPTLEVWGVSLPMPSNFLYTPLPWLRSLSRFGVLAGLGVILLAVVAVADLARRLPRWGRGALVLGMCAVLAFEYRGFAPFPTVPVAQVDPAYVWLGGQAGVAALAEYPYAAEAGFAEDGLLNWWHDFGDRLGQRTHRKPLLGGPSGGLSLRLKRQLEPLNDPLTAARLHWLGIETVVVHLDRLPLVERQRLEANLDYAPLARFGSTGVYGIQADALRVPLSRFFSTQTETPYEAATGRWRATGQGVLLFGPYLALPGGPYQLQLRYHAEGSDGAALRAQLVDDNGRAVLASQELPVGGEVESPSNAKLSFVAPPSGALALELRLSAAAPVALEVFEVTLAREKENP